MILDRWPGSDPLVDLRGGAEAKVQLFQNMVMLHIKSKGMTNAATWSHGSKYFPRRPPPYPGGQKVKIQLFQNSVMLHIKLNGIANAAAW